MARTPRASGVLDASAILAAIYSEPGGNLSEDQLRRARVSTVNAAEVEAKLVQRRGLDDYQLAGSGAISVASSCHSRHPQLAEPPTCSLRIAIVASPWETRRAWPLPPTLGFVLGRRTGSGRTSKG